MNILVLDCSDVLFLFYFVGFIFREVLCIVYTVHCTSGRIGWDEVGEGTK